MAGTLRGAVRSVHRPILSTQFDHDCACEADAIRFAAADREFKPAAEKTFGYTREQAVGNDVSAMIIPPATRDADRRTLARHRGRAS